MRLVNLIPRPIHRLAFRVGHQLRKVWYRRTTPIVHGCSVLARDDGGRFLLVRHSYGPGYWMFPSGGVGKYETPLMAAVREFREELDCGLTDVRRVTTVKEGYHGATNVVHVYTGRIDGEPRPDRREVLEARFFAREQFPQHVSNTVAMRMAAFDAGQSAPAWHKLQKR
jgi:8-oxo-dGTP pyrophosphatase MutT (NUDIX family)